MGQQADKSKALGLSVTKKDTHIIFLAIDFLPKHLWDRLEIMKNEYLLDLNTTSP